jgi:serine/threonine-protein kinase
MKMGSGVEEVDAGYGTTCAIRNGAASCGGDNVAGQLGEGTKDDSTTPVGVLRHGKGVH